jgi:hypothetical protein
MRACLLAFVGLSLPLALQAAAPPMAAVVTQTVVVARMVPEGEELHPAWAASVLSGRQLPSLAEDAPMEPSSDETSANPWCDDLFTPHPLYRDPREGPLMF